MRLCVYIYCTTTVDEPRDRKEFRRLREKGNDGDWAS